MKVDNFKSFISGADNEFKSLIPGHQDIFLAIYRDIKSGKLNSNGDFFNMMAAFEEDGITKHCKKHGVKRPEYEKKIKQINSADRKSFEMKVRSYSNDMINDAKIKLDKAILNRDLSLSQTIRDEISNYYNYVDICLYEWDNSDEEEHAAQQQAILELEEINRDNFRRGKR